MSLYSISSFYVYFITIIQEMPWFGHHHHQQHHYHTHTQDYQTHHHIICLIIFVLILISKLLNFTNSNSILTSKTLINL